jgi:hypothetical protein
VLNKVYQKTWRQKKKSSTRFYINRKLLNSLLDDIITLMKYINCLHKRFKVKLIIITNKTVLMRTTFFFNHIMCTNMSHTFSLQTIIRNPYHNIRVHFLYCVRVSATRYYVKIEFTTVMFLQTF